MKLVILGPPSSGKGTQASALAKDYGIPHISTGDILRTEVDKKTELGQAASSYMADGKLVPDDLVIRMMAKRLSQGDCVRGFILDGYPRTVRQAEALDKDFGVNVVLYIDVTEEEILRRAIGRRICTNCGAIYHVMFNPPKNVEKCDVCGSKLIVREDDTESVVRKRLDLYRERTAHLIERYSGILISIDGNGSPEETLERAKQALEPVGNNV